jgi:hypothetical protein
LQADEPVYEDSSGRSFAAPRIESRDGARGLQRLHDINPVTNTHANSYANAYANAD